MHKKTQTSINLVATPVTRKASGLVIRTALKAGRKTAYDQNPPPETLP